MMTSQKYLPKLKIMICVLYSDIFYIQNPGRVFRAVLLNCFHCLSVNDIAKTFSDREMIREALYTSIRQLWDQCATHPSITALDVIVEIYEDNKGRINGV